jgi:hypothetical protein
VCSSDLKKLPPKPGSNTTLFVTDMTPIASTKTPANFQIRLAGTSGKIDPPGTPEYKRTKDYKGTFAVRVWVTEAQAWKDKTIEAAPDEKLAGTITYKTEDGSETKTLDFDSGYRLVEVKWGEIVKETEVDEPELDKDGNPIMDKKTGRPKTVKVMKKSEPIPNEIAVLENIQEKKLEEFPKRADFEGRKAALRYYARLAAQQETAAPTRKGRGKEVDPAAKVKARVKEYEERKASEKAAQEQPNPTGEVKLGQ